MPITQFRQYVFGMPNRWRKDIAFSSTAGALTFEDLQRDTLRFAAWLMEDADIRPGDRVAVCIPKTLETVVVVHGVFASGGAYVPLEFQSAPERLGAILASVRPKLLITTMEMEQRLRAIEGPLVMPPTAAYRALEDGRGLEALMGERAPATNLPELAPDDLASIVFTSGSTGEPKGVMLSQRNLLETLGWMMRRCHVVETDRRVSHAKLRFLPSDLMYPITAGCRTFLLSDREALFAQHVAEVCERERITLWNSTPTAFRLLIEGIGSRRPDFHSLRHASFHGEPLSIPVMRRAMELMPNTEFANSYGSTEASGMAFYRIPRPMPDDLANLPLGTPSDRYALFICDESGDPVPQGEVGEICAIGPTVMLGYWDDATLTAAKRLGDNPNSYRTGDLGYMGIDGLLHLAGRRDQMIKIRGHRVELGEVEAALRRHPKVRDAAAYAIGINRLEVEIRAAVLTEGGADDQAELRRFCRRHLPNHAQPGRIVAVAEFPMLPTGKVDRLALKAIVERT